MDVDLIFKVAAVGLLAAVINILLQRSGRDEQALMTTIAALVVMAISAIVIWGFDEIAQMIVRAVISIAG